MTYTVQRGDSLYAIARKYNITVEELKKLNNLTTNVISTGQTLKVSREFSGYAAESQKHVVQPGESLYVIAKQYNLTVGQLKQLNRLVSSNLRVGQELIVTQKNSAHSFVSSSANSSVHTVSKGDSLYSIARKHQVTVAHLVKLNGLLSNNLKIGQTLNIAEIPSESPQKIKKTHVVQRGESLYRIAQNYSISVSELMQTNHLTSSNLSVGQELIVPAKNMEIKETEEAPQKTKEEPAPKENSKLIHIVKPGESLYVIARRYGVSVNQLRLLNLLRSDVLSVGQSLKISGDFSKKEEEKEVLPKNKTIHIVEAGESLYGIARKYKLSIRELRHINELNTDFISVGQELKIKETEEDKRKKEDSKKTTREVDLSSLPSQIQQALNARNIITLDIEDGTNLLGNELRGAIGRNRVNKPDDLAKVQKRLEQLGMLSTGHRESPEILSGKIGTGAITANLIPKTIAAIERFQKHFQVVFWIQHSSRVAMMQTSSFTSGVILPGDVTWKVLRDYTEYSIRFPHPHHQRPVVVRFHNFPRSAYTRYYKGISYVGESNPEIPLSVFQRLGVGQDLAQALQHVSKHEGNFDAINSYDKAIFSYGFIQFAGNGGGLAPLLASIKAKAPQVFQEYFQRFGIDVTYTLVQDTIRNAALVVIHPYDKRGDYVKKGTEAEKIIREDKQLHGVFIRAGYYLPIVTLQIDAAIRSYVRPALNIRLNIIAGTLSLNNVPITDYIHSPMGLALLIDLTVNRWINKARDVFRNAIEKVAIRQRLYSKQALRTIDERKIITQVIADAQVQGDRRLIKRATSILNSDLRWQKSYV